MATTALSATQKRRQAEYDKKLLRALRLVEEHAKEQTRLTWKEWVSAKTKGEITEKWLTRAEGLKRLIPPTV
jgi:hypothetical protein